MYVNKSHSIAALNVNITHSFGQIQSHLCIKVMVPTFKRFYIPHVMPSIWPLRKYKFRRYFTHLLFQTFKFEDRTLTQTQPILTISCSTNKHLLYTQMLFCLSLKELFLLKRILSQSILPTANSVIWYLSLNCWFPFPFIKKWNELIVSLIFFFFL